MQIERIDAATPANFRPLDRDTFLIGVLSVTAAVLLMCYVVLSNSATPAHAIGTSDRGGDYILLTQQLSNSTEGLIVIDAAAQRMNLYGLDLSAKQLKLLQNNIPLDKLPGVKPAGDRGGG